MLSYKISYLAHSYAPSSLRVETSVFSTIETIKGVSIDKT